MNQLKNRIGLKRTLSIAMVLFIMSIIPGFTQNPPISNFITLLSTNENSVSVDDTYPEMVIVGNTIHVVWSQLSGNYHVFYRRSTDLGKTWEEPRIVYSLTYQTRESIKNPCSRKLAVDGNNVHIALCDMNQSENWASKIVYLKSTNNGSSFEPAKFLKSMGGDGWFRTCHVKAVNGKVAIVYRGTLNAKPRISLLASADNGVSFNETLIKTWGGGQDADLTDLWYDGNQVIVLWKYSWNLPGSYDWASRPYVSVSNNGGTSFNTILLLNESGEDKNYQKTVQDAHYAPKIAKSGNNIHLIYHGYNKNDQFTVFHSLSTDNGQSFSKVTDINKGLVPVDQIQPGCEAIAAQNGNVYLAFLRKNSALYFTHSADNGMTFAETRNIFPEGYSYVGGTWYPSFAFDPTDPTGKTVYAYGSGMVSTKTTDGGKTFYQHLYAAPIFSSLRTAKADLLIDQQGNKHWISEYVWFERENISDVYYKKIVAEPEPGKINKAFFVETVYNGKTDVVVVPPSPSIDFDSSFTAEAWIKFDLASLPDNYEVGILGKINGTDGSNYNPSCFVITYKKTFGKMCLYSSIETDKGDFINFNRDKGYLDTLWHHIAITYDAKAGANNFRSYVDGVLTTEQTVTGKLNQGNGLFLIGRMTSYRQSSKIHYDDVRLWNRALSQNELLENQTKTLSGKEDGLKLFINFNDTYKDITGNGNDGLPNYWGDLRKSDFNPPISDFDSYIDLSKVTLTNKTQNGSSYSWDYGDGKTSLLENPVYTYPKPGEYTVALTAKNSNSATSRLKKVTIAGLDRIEPTSAGNRGLVSLTIYGGGLSESNTSVYLRKKSKPNIDGINLKSTGNGQLTALFDLMGVDLGKWDIVLVNNGIEQSLNEAFTIVQGVAPDPWLSITGRNMVLLNMWQTYTINYGNNGNTDALGVPMTLIISDVKGIDIELVDFSISYTNFAKNNFQNLISERTKNYDIRENYFGDGQNARVFEMIIPVIKANSSKAIHFRVKSPLPFNIEGWVNQPVFETENSNNKSIVATTDDWPDEKTKLNACVAASAMHAASSIAADIVGNVLPIGCAYDILTQLWNPWDAVKPDRVETETTFDKTLGWAAAIGGCVDDLIPPAKLLMMGFQIGQAIYEGYQKNEECHRNFDPLYKNRLGVKTVSSFDPNEMIGPSGFGDQNWIQISKRIPYTILFENKSSATAPAHEVYITDSLDLNNYDINEFGFNSFGFGDTIITLGGNNLKKFTVDVDMRPKIESIARVTGNLDTLTGVINWHFKSLTPSTMSIEEDPFIGFLPPNNSEHAGEGFVSYMTGIKENLTTNSELKNKATIVFDANKPIVTNEYTNTLDLDKPQSSVKQLEATTGNYLTLSWGGDDLGSGIQEYSVFYLENDTLLQPVIVNTTETSTLFVANVGSKYKFYSLATDNVSLKEDDPSVYDASTHVTVDAKEFSDRKDEIQIFPNPVKGEMNVILPGASEGVYLVEMIDMKGKSCFSDIYECRSISGGIKIKTEQFSSGLYLVRIVHGNSYETRKIRISNKPEK